MVGLFGKPALPERAAALRFLAETTWRAALAWPEVKHQLTAVLGSQLEEEPEILDRPASLIAFQVVLTATQFQAAANLCPAPQAERLLHQVALLLKENVQFGDDRAVLFLACHQMFAKSLLEGLNPVATLAVQLLDEWGLEDDLDFEGAEFWNPITLAPLVVILSTAGGAWWRDTLAQHRIVQEAA